MYVGDTGDINLSAPSANFSFTINIVHQLEYDEDSKMITANGGKAEPNVSNIAIFAITPAAKLGGKNTGVALYRSLHTKSKIFQL